MLIAVGSKNPTKIAAVKDVFDYYFEDVKVEGIDAQSGVSEQPLSEEETYQGALNRAKGALQASPDAEYGVGVEGGLTKAVYGWYESSLVVIINKNGEVGVGSSGGLVLPDKISEMIHSGMNLEQAVDKMFNTEKIGRGIGMFGVMTKEYVTRSSGTAHGVAFALSRFLHADKF
jgi:inosine/xanthosine triphosphatase